MSAINHKAIIGVLAGPVIAVMLAVAIIFAGITANASASRAGAPGAQKTETILLTARPGCTDGYRYLPDAQMNHAACSLGLSCFIFADARDASRAEALLGAMFVTSNLSRLSSRPVIPPTPPPDLFVSV